MANVFTVQDDDGSVANANSYITEAEFDTYVNDRGLTHGHSQQVVETACVMATDYIDYRFNYVGKKRSQEQTTEWPRYDARDRDERLVTGIPIAVKEACAELAWASASSATGELVTNPDRDSSGQVVESSRVKVDVIEAETEYMGGGVFSMPKYPRSDMKLVRAGLVLNTVGGDIRRA